MFYYSDWTERTGHVVSVVCYCMKDVCFNIVIGHEQYWTCGQCCYVRYVGPPML